MTSTNTNKLQLCTVLFDNTRFCKASEKEFWLKGFIKPSIVELQLYIIMSAHTLCVLPTSFTQLEKHLCARNCPLFKAIAQGPQWGSHEQLLLPAWITCHEYGLILRVLFVLAAWYIRLM